MSSELHAAMLRVLPLVWEREPSEQVCIVECGSRCCQAPGMEMSLTGDGVRRLRLLATREGVDFEPVRVHTKNDAWTLPLNPCVFLDERGYCRIYDDRPDACRVFPHKPFQGCLVYPGQEGDSTL
jgi:Fe-S-cluster containining protein